MEGSIKGSFLFARVSQAGEDRRFRKMKHHFLEFLMTWTLQGLWVVMTLAAALTAMTTDQAVPLDLFALIGALVWAIGWLIESWRIAKKPIFGRFQKTRKRSLQVDSGPGRVTPTTLARLRFGWGSQS